MTLGIAGKERGIGRQNADEIAARAAVAGVLGTTEYWSPRLHVASFDLPPYIARHLPGD
jgi:spermidine synthase